MMSSEGTACPVGHGRMVGGATFAKLGAICITGGLYEHRLMLREANA